MTISANPRTCPICASALQPVMHEGSELDRCDHGHGLWLDRGELRAVVASEEQDRPRAEEIAALDAGAASTGQELVQEASRDARACPVCQRAMRVAEYAASGVVIDECIEHGVWLDSGELERIEAYAEGVREQARGGAASDAARMQPAGTPTGVRGIEIPEHLMATIRRAAAPPPGV